jgi:phage head maturation protease
MPRSETSETLVCFGGECKALDDSGRVGGYLVMWGSPGATDLSRHRDYFVRDTDFWTDFPARKGMVYHHGLDPTLDLRRLGDAELKADDVGLWMEGQLKLRDDYERKVWDLVKVGKLGLSSGSASHLVRREKQANGSHKIVSWPLVEASLTPAPAEPRTAALPLKSLLDPGDSPESFIESCLRAATELEQAARRFAKVGPTKRQAIKAVRDSLDALLVVTEPQADPDELRWLYSQFRDVLEKI